MSHRRSSSLTGGARVSEEQVPSAKARTRPAPPLKASSFDYGDHGAPGGPGIEGEDGMRRGRPENLAQAAMSVAHSTYEALENRSEAIMQRFDDSIDELENGPLVQTAKATVQKVATVIEKPVGLIKQSRFVEEVSGVLTEIENTEVVQVARGRARQAYMYVEPISEKILSRVGSFDADEDENVQFVIPPSMQRSPGRVVDVPLKPRPLLRPYEIEGQRVKLDPTQYAIQEEVPEIHVSGEDGRLSVLSQGSDKLLKVKAPDQISIVSATDSERQYELVRPHRLYRTPPLPPPRHKEPRRSLQARLSNNGVKTSLVEESSERRQDGEEGLCRCGSSARSVRFTEKDSTSKKDGAAGASKGSGKEPSSSTLTVKRMVDVEERRPAIKDQQYMESVDKRNSLLDECTEDQPLVPIEMEGCSISKIREKLREYNYSVICINGKTFYVPKSIVKEPEPREVYGGASTFFEASETIDWKTVKGIYSVAFNFCFP
ncbi:hypothetical protein E2C01_053116 [Portunus trituberculatus]|uniref:Uncharacterized protein n=1 Tax=Portunus trituberculatus TaxID=210409 RepID=A0A5B7GG83_PORTR|nr:hypothetical protein [Portunus trituberculatus]